MSAGWVIRWRSDASGFVAKYAGQVAGRFETYGAADEIRRAMVNGAQTEIVSAGIPDGVPVAAHPEVESK